MNHEHIHHAHHDTWQMGAHVTAHCLIGCVVGEIARLLIGVSVGLSAWATMGLATVLAHAVGGVQAGSVFAPVFWTGFAGAIPAGFLAAWHVNIWLLSRNLSAGH